MVERTLEYAISSRSQDSPYLIARVMQNTASQWMAWNFVQAYWATLENLGGAFAGGTIVQATGDFCDEKVREEVKIFFTPRPAPAAERSLKQSIERMNCVDLKAQQQNQLASWLHRHSGSETK